MLYKQFTHDGMVVCNMRALYAVILLKLAALLAHCTGRL